jgi:hypothetical protein
MATRRVLSDWVAHYNLYASKVLRLSHRFGIIARMSAILNSEQDIICNFYAVPQNY